MTDFMIKPIVYLGCPYSLDNTANEKERDKDMHK